MRISPNCSCERSAGGRAPRATSSPCSRSPSRCGRRTTSSPCAISVRAARHAETPREPRRPPPPGLPSSAAARARSVDLRAQPAPDEVEHAEDDRRDRPTRRSPRPSPRASRAARPGDPLQLERDLERDRAASSGCARATTATTAARPNPMSVESVQSRRAPPGRSRARTRTRARGPARGTRRARSPRARRRSRTSRFGCSTPPSVVHRLALRLRDCAGTRRARSDLRPLRSSVGRPGGIRTPNPRFWRPLLYRWSYWPEACRRSAYFVSLCSACLRQRGQYLESASLSWVFFLFFVVV